MSRRNAARERTRQPCEGTCNPKGDRAGPRRLLVAEHLADQLQGRAQEQGADLLGPNARLDGFSERIIALYARGMTTRDIRAHLRQMYDVEFPRTRSPESPTP